MGLCNSRWFSQKWCVVLVVDRTGWSATHLLIMPGLGLSYTELGGITMNRGF